MGIKLSDLVESEKWALADFSKKKIAIDGFIVLYQFITSIRMSDGSMLTDYQGRPVSHLKGIDPRHLKCGPYPVGSEPNSRVSTFD